MLTWIAGIEDYRPPLELADGLSRGVDTRNHPYRALLRTGRFDLMLQCLGGACLCCGSLSRPEFRWIAWLLAVVATYKVLFQDRRQAQSLAIVLSLLIYGSVLILLLKVVRTGRKAS